MNPVDGGDIYWMPLNMIDAKKSDTVVKDQQGNLVEVKSRAIESRAQRSANLRVRIAQSYRGLFEEATLRIIKFERSDILKAAETIFKKRNITLLNFTEYLTQYYADKYDDISKRIKPVISTYSKTIYEAAADEINASVNAGSLDKFIDQYAEAFNKRYITTSQSRLEEVVANAIENDIDPYGVVESKFNEWEAERPQVVANKETIKIAGAISLFTYTAAGIQRIIWINTGSKSCPFCEALDGKVVGSQQPYMTKDGSMEAEGKSPLTFSTDIFHPPLHGGCVCMISAG
jgi:hypothetical protein